MYAGPGSPWWRKLYAVSCVFLPVGWIGGWWCLMCGVVMMVSTPLSYSPTLPPSFTFHSGGASYSALGFQEDVYLLTSSNQTLWYTTIGIWKRSPPCSYSIVHNVTGFTEEDRTRWAEGDEQTVTIPSCTSFTLAMVASWMGVGLSTLPLPIALVYHMMSPANYHTHLGFCGCAWLLGVLSGGYWAMEGVEAEVWVGLNVMLGLGSAAWNTWLCWWVHRSWREGGGMVEMAERIQAVHHSEL